MSAAFRCWDISGGEDEEGGDRVEGQARVGRIRQWQARASHLPAGKGGPVRLTTRCGRCGELLAHIPPPDACWYCDDPLCSDCWERFAHCGHPEADEINERSRRGEVQSLDWARREVKP